MRFVMRGRHTIDLAVFVLAFAEFTSSGLLADGGGQTAKPKASTGWTVPRTPDGHPDLQGRWSFATLTPLERAAGAKAFLTEEEALQLLQSALARGNEEQGPPGSSGTGSAAGERTSATPARERAKPASASASLGGAPQPPPLPAYNAFWMNRGSGLVRIGGVIRSSLVVDPPEGRVPPLTPEGLKRASDVMTAQNTAARAENRPAMERCILGFNTGPPLTPGAYNNNVEIIQNRDSIVMLNENVHSARIVPTDGRPHGKIRRWLGESRGRWEGETLVIDTRNFLNSTGVTDPRLHGDGGGPRLHLIERLTRMDADTIVYAATVEDPDMWPRPWTMEFTFTRTDEPILEYACHEGNYGLPNGLSGIRSQERAATEAAKKREPTK